MFYETEGGGHGLARDPFKALIAPRPIGWISSVDGKGRANLAPYSFFNAVSSNPPVVMFSSDGKKDSMTNIEETGCFVCNLAVYGLRDQMNKSSATVAHGVSEFELAELTPAPSRLVAAPRVGEAPAALECQYLKTIPVPTVDGGESGNFMILGQVVGIHIDDSLIVDGRVDMIRLAQLSRLGYMDYSVVGQVFAMDRPEV
ncbi:flavin reductase (DIM6/NTAB) family NADH-FMN oxidoreductase RutF [Rhodobium orientis]|uniref:Flavin reductase n=1 Tax=Rhodobium orientis TaxID=34017 RepID=A0A327JRA9_9HYPH|nr:flavin reductase family protein [Rhodobium orientis]MBB4301684.1 flavin reductase (DIM6/NTAB) family NADH-FMN oxidoreductase RutF [Rhodobium orientis]MBK5952378.1 flavin reductase [Rhodobium orientis]RAI28135.1 flavin reductase [Rhodobium orientis]